MVGVWMAPVTAQVITTLRGDFGLVASAMRFSLGSIGGMGFLRALVRDQRGEALVAPQGLRGDLLARGRASPRLAGELPMLVVPHARGGKVGHVAPEPRDIALAIIGHAAGSVELDGLERAHERPSQAQPIGDRMVEVL